MQPWSIRPAEISAGSTLFFDHLFTEAGFPEHVYQTTLISIDQVSTFIADPRLRVVTLTGSDRAGSSVGEQAGRAPAGLQTRAANWRSYRSWVAWLLRARHEDARLPPARPRRPDS